MKQYKLIAVSQKMPVTYLFDTKDLKVINKVLSIELGKYTIKSIKEVKNNE